jgi:phosphatidylinositol glycan class F
VELKRSKQHELKFTIGRDYNVILVGLILCCLAIVPIYLGLILFGAPFSTYFIENVYLAAHLSFLSYPIVLAYLNLGKQSHFYKYIISIMVGAWLGAIVIPLDWDRPWQNWPLPIIGGGYLGAIVGYSLCELV